MSDNTIMKDLPPEPFNDQTIVNSLKASSASPKDVTSLPTTLSTTSTDNVVSIVGSNASMTVFPDSQMEGYTPQAIPEVQPTITTSTTNGTPVPAINAMPIRVGTPSASTHAGPNGTPSRAASVQAEPAVNMPTVAQKHGAPARQYLNAKVTPHTLEIFKKIAVDQPDNPIRVLADFFNERAKELGQ